MDTKKMYAYIADWGEGCFMIILYCDGAEGRVAFWSDGEDIALDVDQPVGYSKAMKGFVYTHADFSRLIKLCRRMLRRRPYGHIDELPVSFCFR